MKILRGKQNNANLISGCFYHNILIMPSWNKATGYTKIYGTERQIINYSQLNVLYYITIFLLPTRDDGRQCGQDCSYKHRPLKFY